MDREEMWVEDLEWIEGDEDIDEMLGSVLVVFDEYGSVLTVRNGAVSRSQATQSVESTRS